MESRLVKRLDPELAYLVLLTGEQIKPMSRWEKSFGLQELDILRKLELGPRIIPRRIKTNEIVQEVIFGRIGPHLDIYQRRFAGSLIDKSPEATRLEGFLFGYPNCCVEDFIHKGYQKNGLHPDAQKILFHWACRGCEATPFLLPEYQRVWKRCENIFAQPPVHTLSAPLWRRLSRRAAVVAATTCLLLAPVLTTWAQEGDPHLMPVTEDRDEDGLKDSEESYFNANPDNPDSDGSGVPDGIQVAKEIWQTIQQLPREAGTSSYVTEYPLFGLETCAICGETVNMGYIEVANGATELSMQIPYIGVHYLVHGSLSYNGDLHDGRVNPILFSRIMGGAETPDPHLLPIENDIDSDGLNGTEEAHFNLNSDNADTNTNGIWDGAELAQQMIAAIENLGTGESNTEPYKVEYVMRGIETCETCGLKVNMGYIEVVNPAKSLQVDIPYIAIHYLEHGSFAYSGDLHKDRIDPVELAQVLGIDTTPVGPAFWGRVKAVYK